MSRNSPSVVFDTPAGQVVRYATAATTAITLDRETHSNRLVLYDVVCTGASITFSLPQSTGSGDKYEIVNNAIQTVNLVVAAWSTDVFAGIARLFPGGASTVAMLVDVFHSTATSDKYTFNFTTSGGLRGDRFEAWDISSGTWYVQIHATILSANAAGATGFAAS